MSEHIGQHFDSLPWDIMKPNLDQCLPAGGLVQTHWCLHWVLYIYVPQTLAYISWVLQTKCSIICSVCLSWNYLVYSTTGELTHWTHREMVAILKSIFSNHLSWQFVQFGSHSTDILLQGPNYQLCPRLLMNINVVHPLGLNDIHISIASVKEYWHTCNLLAVQKKICKLQSMYH